MMILRRKVKSGAAIALALSLACGMPYAVPGETAASEADEEATLEEYSSEEYDHEDEIVRMAAGHDVTHLEDGFYASLAQALYTPEDDDALREATDTLEDTVFTLVALADQDGNFTFDAELLSESFLTGGYTAEELSEKFGEHVDEENVKALLNTFYRAFAYGAYYAGSLQFADEEYEEAYTKVQDLLDLYSYTCEAVPYSEEDKEEKLEALAAQEDPSADAEVLEDVRYDSLPALCSEWLADPAREEGDSQIFDDEENLTLLSVTFDSRAKDEEEGANLTSILVKANDWSFIPDEEEQDKAKERADELVEAGTDAFAKAIEQSDEANHTYAGMTKDTLTEEAAAWAMDPERAEGDIAAFEVDGGWRVFRYDGKDGMPAWQKAVHPDLVSEAMEALTEESGIPEDEPFAWDAAGEDTFPVVGYLFDGALVGNDPVILAGYLGRLCDGLVSYGANGQDVITDTLALGMVLKLEKPEPETESQTEETDEPTQPSEEMTTGTEGTRSTESTRSTTGTEKEEETTASRTTQGSTKTTEPTERTTEKTTEKPTERKTEEATDKTTTPEPTTSHEHAWKEAGRTEATCVKAGSITYTCATCGRTRSESIPATGKHTWTTTETPATCGEAGSRTVKCSVCGETQSSAAIPATGNHNWVEASRKEATCGTAGSVTYTCATCGKTRSESIQATGKHNWTTKTQNATCTAAGKQSVICSVCGAVQTEKTIAATGHKWVESSRTEATCSAKGIITYTCSVCGEKKTETTQATGNHTWTTQERKATCSREGKRVTLCSVCGQLQNEETIPATGHSWAETGRTAATCGTAGSVSYKCSVCGQTKSEPLAATGNHSWTTRTQAATCTAAGKKTTVCSVCGAVQGEEAIAATGHKWTETGRTPATCAAAGSVNYKCSTCGQTKSEPLAATGQHTWVTSDTPATCGAAGSRTVKCSVCGTVQSTTPIPATGQHTWAQTGHQDATCGAAGFTDYKCSVCGTTTRETIPATGQHTWTDVTTVVHHDEVGHYDTVTVVDQEAWDETVTTTVWEEQMWYGTHYDGFESRSREEVEAHIAAIEASLDWKTLYATKPIEEVDAILSSLSRYDSLRNVPVETQTIVHHDAVTHTEQRYVVDQAAWDETVVTGHKCSTCGAVQ